LLLRIDVFFAEDKGRLHSEKPLTFQIPVQSLFYTVNSPDRFEGQDVHDMTQREAELLLFLCKNPNRLLTREEILVVEVWGRRMIFIWAEKAWTEIHDQTP
jgi:DNA-binding response OmpR family regulator